MTPLSPLPASANGARRRLGVIQRVLTTYRAPFFDWLAETAGFDVAVLAGQPMAGEVIKVVDEMDHAQFYAAKNRYWLGPGNMIIWQSNVGRWLRDFDPDVLVLEANPRILSHGQAIRWMHRRRRPVLGWGLGELERAGPGWSLTMRRLIAHKLIRSFDGMIAYSTKAKADYVVAGVAPDSVFIAHNSIDNTESERYLRELSGSEWTSAWRAKYGLDPHLPIVLFVGRLIASKRIDMLIRACIPLFSCCQLLIVGDGPARTDLEKQAALHSNSIHFIGHQTGKALAQSFVASDIFVLPGAGGLALHQAMSYGKPAIASFGDGTEADLIRDGQNGFIFRFGDINDLTSKIKALLSIPEAVHKMGQVSLAIVREEINQEKMAASFMLAIETVQSMVYNR